MLTAFICITALIYNLAVLGLLWACLQAMNLRYMLREKRPTRDSVLYAIASKASTSQGTTEVDKAAVMSVQPAPDGGGDSYSRITGAAGAVVLTAFVWGLGNAVIYNAYASPDKVGSMLSGVGPFILAASALFAPYAFNQLSTLFPSKSSS